MGLMDWLCCYEFSIAFGSETDLQVLSCFWMHIGTILKDSLRGSEHSTSYVAKIVRFEEVDLGPSEFYRRTTKNK